jgi:hypothetical protein
MQEPQAMHSSAIFCQKSSVTFPARISWEAWLKIDFDSCP